MSLKDSIPKSHSPRMGKEKEKIFKGHELRVAKLLNAKLTKASGALREKGDGVSKILKFECKSTTKDSLRILRSWLDKISKEGLESNREPVFSFEFSGTGQKWISFREDFVLKNFKELL